jgi:hypothetical protein
VERRDILKGRRKVLVTAAGNLNLSGGDEPVGPRRLRLVPNRWQGGWGFM